MGAYHYGADRGHSRAHVNANLPDSSPTTWSPTASTPSPTTMAPTASTPSPTTAAPTPAITCGNFCNDYQVSMCGSYCRAGTDSCSACSSVETKPVYDITQSRAAALGCSSTDFMLRENSCASGCAKWSTCLAGCSNRALVNSYIQFRYGCSCTVGGGGGAGGGAGATGTADEGATIKPMKLVFVAAVLGTMMV